MREGWKVMVRHLDGRRGMAFLTTEHPASSYGLHVLDHGGVALGSAEVLAVIAGPPEALEAAQRAGYTVLPEPVDKSPLYRQLAGS